VIRPVVKVIGFVNKKLLEGSENISKSFTPIIFVRTIIVIKRAR
jgi:hypothetical protein